MYAAIPALLANLVVTVLLTPVFRLTPLAGALDITEPAAYIG